jgi:hypothetical protein
MGAARSDRWDFPWRGRWREPNTRRCVDCLSGDLGRHAGLGSTARIVIVGKKSVLSSCARLCLSLSCRGNHRRRSRPFRVLGAGRSASKPTSAGISGSRAHKNPAGPCGLAQASRHASCYVRHSVRERPAHVTPRGSGQRTHHPEAEELGATQAKHTIGIPAMPEHPVTGRPSVATAAPPGN